MAKNVHVMVADSATLQGQADLCTGSSCDRAHDMNSVMGIGENILFIYKGRKEWVGTKDEVMNVGNQHLNDLVFASDLFKKVKEVENNEYCECKNSGNGGT